MRCYREAIRLDPNYADAYIEIAAIFHDEKRYEDAVQYYNNAIRINPNSAIYYCNKGKVLQELDRREEAMECYRNAIRIDPNNDIAHYNLILLSENENKNAKCALF